MLIIAAAILLIYFVVTDNSENDSNQSDDTKPNIIYIMMDDLGLTDTGYYSNYQNGNDYSYSTSNIESLANKGIKLNWHYSEPVCSS